LEREEDMNEKEEEGKEEDEKEARYYTHDVEDNNISLNFIYFFS